MTCDPFGRWRSSMFDVIGESIEAVCYRPSIYYSFMNIVQVRDDAGDVRTATKIDCSHTANWVLTEEGTGEEIAVTGSEATVTCEYSPPPCQLCPRLLASPECPGAAHRPCFPLTQKGGVSDKSCRLNTCEPGDELWVKLPSGWTHPDKLSMLGCAGDQGWIGNDGVTKLPPNAEAVCKRAPCDNCVVPTISAFCPEEHGEKGCDSFAMRRNGTRFDEKSGCTSIICPNEGKIAFHNPVTGSLVTATKQMHCANGQWLTDLGEPVPPTLHVTCVQWSGSRSVCGNGGCTAKMRYSEVGGCYELYCATGNILGFNPKYSSWEPANQGHFTCTDKGWKQAYGVIIPDVTDYRFHIRVKCQ
ncbi:hypothetical protein PENTCL1PPCAC_20161 [Pristionchus entomophagus]|uniref:Sushi domain-containing protein n=1 Tax=Pristionchus entomophagus TaxID=358040 RepID=A0AAV5TUN5_9BILA|nr:hypothetical protein PENTCL1PPCAC_20161 [Pristionchus entomophagus]